MVNVRSVSASHFPWECHFAPLPFSTCLRAHPMRGAHNVGMWWKPVSWPSRTPILVPVVRTVLGYESPGWRSPEIGSMPRAGVLYSPHRRQPKKHVASHVTHVITQFDVPASQRVIAGARNPDSGGAPWHAPRALFTPEKCKIAYPPGGPTHPESLVRMPPTIFPLSVKNLAQTDTCTNGKWQLILPV